LKEAHSEKFKKKKQELFVINSPPKNKPKKKISFENFSISKKNLCKDSFPEKLKKKDLPNINSRNKKFFISRKYLFKINARLRKKKTEYPFLSTKKGNL
jgi:hypothetical protein